MRRETGRGEERYKILALEIRCHHGCANAGPKPAEEDARSEVSEWELREQNEREEESEESEEYIGSRL